MRSIRRALAATAASLVMAAAGIAAAGPAAASPEDGQGCVGTPAVPASYVCLISLTPGNAVPSVTTTPIPVDVPPVCYFLDCTEPSTVNVPVPSGGLNDGDVAVLWYQGRYYPIGIAVAGQVVQLVLDVTFDTVETVVGIVNDLPTTGELLQQLRDVYQPYVDTINEILNNLPTAEELVEQLLNNRYVRTVLDLVQRLLEEDACTTVEGPVNNVLRKITSGLEFTCG